MFFLRAGNGGMAGRRGVSNSMPGLVVPYPWFIATGKQGMKQRSLDARQGERHYCHLFGSMQGDLHVGKNFTFCQVDNN
jgi:hypothetical protein